MDGREGAGWYLWLHHTHAHRHTWQLLALLDLPPSVTHPPPYLCSLPGTHFAANILHSERLKKIAQHYPRCLSTSSQSTQDSTSLQMCAPCPQRQSHRSSQAGSPRSQALSPLPRPLAQHRLRLWERRPPRRERADLCWRKHLCSEGEGEPFPTISCSVRGPGAGVAARGLFFEAEPHIMRLLTGALRHRAKTQDGYLSINLTLHPPAFYLLT